MLSVMLRSIEFWYINYVDELKQILYENLHNSPFVYSGNDFPNSVLPVAGPDTRDITGDCTLCNEAWRMG